MKIISGNSNIPLARDISKELGIPLTHANVRRFADGEIFVEVLENVRGEDIFIIQSTNFPTNDNIMELLILLDALVRGSAATITTVIPYFGYARQDRKTGPRTPITAKLVARLLETSGANRVTTLDLHAAQIQGFFDVPNDNLFGVPVLRDDLLQQVPPEEREDIMVVSPDVGGVVRARALAKKIDVNLAIIDKRRERAGISEVMHIIGDPKGRHCVLFDDIVDSAGTLCNASTALMNAGAKSVRAYVTHGVLSGGAVERIVASPLKELVITNSIQATQAVEQCTKIRQVTVAPLLAEAMRRISCNESVSSLFN